MATATLDAVLRAAVDLARTAAEEVAGSPDLVGEHVAAVVEGERLVAHQFRSTAPGYPGWQWTVTLARVPRGRTPTVCEVALLPGEDAILAPAWVPWAERIQPGDVGPGDVLPYQADDDRLDQGYEATGDVDVDTVAIHELGLGRRRVLSRRGRDDASARWYTGSRGPTAPIAVAAEQSCSTCGFLVLLAGSMRSTFGVCANEWSPEDGRVVSMDHGCGAHSETDVPPPRSEWPSAPAGGELDLEPTAGATGARERSAAAGADADGDAAPTGTVDDQAVDEQAVDEQAVEESTEAAEDA